jgi:nucleotide-binding universal stress UspA family protein
MFKHILIATDGSELAAKAVTTGLEIAKALAAKITFVTVTEPRTHLVPVSVSLPPVLTEDDKALRRAAETVLENACAVATELNIVCTSVHVPNAFPAEAILKTAKDKQCDVIVMASHGRRGLARLVLGGETLRVVTHSAIPVLVCR